MAPSLPLLLGTEAVCEVKVHPVVIFQILDRSLRRSEEQGRVIGTLLGRVENGIAEITNSFAVPHLENGDEVAVGKDYHTQMYELHQRVNENEMIVGWYATTNEDDQTGLVNDHSCLIHEFYGSVCEMPVHMVVDTSLKQDDMKISAFISTPLEMVETALIQQFKQIPVNQKINEPEAIALNAMIPSITTNQYDLPNDLKALENVMTQLYTTIENTSCYVDQVINGTIPANAKIGQEIADALASIPMIRSDQFDQLFNTSLQDILMVSYLSGLTQAQLSMTEKLINT